jgi:hypothetical protein
MKMKDLILYLSKTITEPLVLFRASEAPWIQKINWCLNQDIILSFEKF